MIFEATGTGSIVCRLTLEEAERARNEGYLSIVPMEDAALCQAIREEIRGQAEVPEEIRQALEVWLAYKREQFRFTYKPLGLQALVEELVEMGPERAMAAVKHSKAKGYKGLFEKPTNGHAPAAEGPFCTPEQLAHVKRIVTLRTEGPEPPRSLAYYRKVFESLDADAFEPGYMAYVEDAFNRRRK